MEAQVRQFRWGDVAASSAELVVDGDGFLIRTDERRILLPAGGVSGVHQHEVECYEHYGNMAYCHESQHDDPQAEPGPVAGYRFWARDTAGTELAFTVRRAEPVRAVLERASAARGPESAVTWRTPSYWLVRSMIALYVVGASILFGFGVWDSFHLEQVRATITGNVLDGDGERVCDLAWTDEVGTVGYQGYACTDADEKGVEITVWWSPLWDDVNDDLFTTAFFAGVGSPAFLSVVLAIVMYLVGAILWLRLEAPCQRHAKALDARHLRRIRRANGADRPASVGTDC